jgi:3-methyladenine DNA glycosylase AlkD
MVYSFCSKRSHETEFFIQKAIGWALRQYHRTDSKAVETYIQKNRTKLAKLSVREALKHSSTA